MSYESDSDRLERVEATIKLMVEIQSLLLKGNEQLSSQGLLNQIIFGQIAQVNLEIVGLKKWIVAQPSAASAEVIQQGLAGLEMQETIWRRVVEETSRQLSNLLPLATAPLLPPLPPKG